MKWISLVDLLWIAVAPAYADSETVDSTVWERLIGHCVADGADPPKMRYGNLKEGTKEQLQAWEAEVARLKEGGIHPSWARPDLWEPGIESLPEDAKAIARRARRCQNRVRLRILQLAEQCLSTEQKDRLDEKMRGLDTSRKRAQWRFHETWRFLYYYSDCKAQLYDLIGSYDECCTVIPGY